MKIIQTVAGIDERASGPSYSVPGLCRGLYENGADVRLLVPGIIPDIKYPYPVKNYPRDDFPFLTMGRSTALKKAVIEEAKTADIIHSNGRWLFSNVYPACAARKSNAKLVSAPRGTFAKWCRARHKLKKILFETFFQNAADAQTDLFHATCEKEYEEIRQMGYKQPIAIVPIGMDIPSNIIRTHSPMRRLIFFGRIHKVKGCDRLMYAWARLHHDFPNWELVIAGPDSGALPEIKEIIALEKLPRISFTGELLREKKYEFLASGDLYVLPTETENFGVTIAESLACKTPVITTKGTCWNELNGNKYGKSGWWIDNTIDALTQTLREAMLLPPETLASYGENGSTWIQNDFSWQGIGKKMLSAYSFILGKGDKPPFVSFD